MKSSAGHLAQRLVVILGRRALPLRDHVEVRPRLSAPKPHQTLGQALHHLVTAKSTEAIERSSHTAAVAAKMQLQAAVGAPRIVITVQDHRRLIAA